MIIQIEITEAELRQLVLNHIKSVMGDVPISDGDISIEVKSKQNYKSEWESASFRARVNKHTA